jgi:hypothetical protein
MASRWRSRCSFGSTWFASPSDKPLVSGWKWAVGYLPGR